MTANGQPSDSIGKRVAAARKLAGFSQVRLAAAANVGYSTLFQVEQGKLSPTNAFLGAVSAVMGVDVAELTGQPYTSMPGDGHAVHSAIAPIRNELASFDLDNEDVIISRDLDEIAREVGDIARYRHNAAFTKLGQKLPPLLSEVRAVAHRSAGHDRERAFGMLCELYHGSYSLVHKLGYPDLATIAIERLNWAAAQSASPLWLAAGQFYRAAILTSGGNWSAALTFLSTCQAQVEPRMGTDSRDALIAMGGLHLQSGLAAARAGQADDSRAHVAEARIYAERVGDERDPLFSFGTTNVGIWEVALAVEGSRATEALDCASKLIIPGHIPPERVAHHYADVARAQIMNGDRTGAFTSLMKARTAAPQQTRYHPLVHETVRAIARAEARRKDSVHGFAMWCGITGTL